MPESAGINPGIILSGLIIAGAFCQWFSWWVKIPSILFLLIIGIVTGPYLGWLQPEELFGSLLFPFVSLAVAIILFEGSLTLNFTEIKGISSSIRNLITIGAVITGVLATLACRFIMGSGWEVAGLFGCIMTVSGPTVIIPMLRSIRPTANVANILRWEGILIDPIGATATVLLFDLILSRIEESSGSHIITAFLLIIAIGCVFGGLLGWVYGWLLRHHLIPEYLQNISTLGLVCLLFTGSNAMVHESGILAVTVMGIVLANMKGVDLRMMIHFKESLSMILISSLFILLAAELDLKVLFSVFWQGLALFACIQFVIRPLAVFSSTIGSGLNFGEKILLSWITPKGIVAAAVASFFAWKLHALKVEGAPMLVIYTFMIIICTVSLGSLTSRFVGKLVGACESSIHGILITGANAFARDIAECLVNNGFPVTVADESAENIQEARMAGLTTYFGNPISEHAERHLHLSGYGKLLALKHDRKENTLACMHFAHDFGKRSVYLLDNSAGPNLPDRRRYSGMYRGYTLFGKDITFSKLMSLYAQGYRCKSTNLSDDFNFESFKEKNPSSIVMFAVTPQNELQVMVENGNVVPKSGWKLISFSPPMDTQEVVEKRKEQSEG